MNYEAGIIHFKKDDQKSELNHKDLNTFKEHRFKVKFNNPPVVTANVTTFNGSNTPGLRIAEVTPEGFKFRLNEIVIQKGEPTNLSDGGHVAEEISYIAVERNVRIE